MTQDALTPAFVDEKLANGSGFSTSQEAKGALGLPDAAFAASALRLIKKGKLAHPFRGLYLILRPEDRSVGAPTRRSGLGLCCSPRVRIPECRCLYGLCSPVLVHPPHPCDERHPRPPARGGRLDGPHEGHRPRQPREGRRRRRHCRSEGGRAQDRAHWQHLPGRARYPARQRRNCARRGLRPGRNAGHPGGRHAHALHASARARGAGPVHVRFPRIGHVLKAAA